MGRFGFLRRGAWLSVLARLAGVGLVIPSVAAAKVTSVTSCQDITAPGKYRLDADISSNGGVCFDIKASDVTLLLNGHTITPTGRGPIAIIARASGATILGPGTITGRWDTGIVLAGGGGKLRGVTVTALAVPIGPAIRLASAGNDVRGNVLTDNDADGIAAASQLGTGNTIVGNFAHDNGRSGGFDLADGNPNCDSNVWRGNDFGTANESCIH
jgi:hypothetical protein